MANNELILYHSPDGKTELQLRAEDGSVWLTHLEMAELFDTTKQNVSLHINNILTEGELPQEATVKESLTVQAEGNRQVQRKTFLYNLYMILAVGYTGLPVPAPIPMLGRIGAPLCNRVSMLETPVFGDFFQYCGPGVSVFPYVWNDEVYHECCIYQSGSAGVGARACGTAAG